MRLNPFRKYIIPEHFETLTELRRRLLVDEDVGDPDALAYAAERAFKLERKRAGKRYRDLRAEDLDRLVKLALEEKEKLAAIMTKKVVAGGAYGMI